MFKPSGYTKENGRKKLTYSSGSAVERSLGNFFFVVEKSGSTGSAAAAWFVGTLELLDSRELEESEGCSVTKLLLEAGDEVGVDDLLGGFKSISGINFTVDGDLVVVGVGTVDEDEDVVLRLGLWSRSAEALTADSDVVELGLGYNSDSGVDVDAKEQV